MHFARRHVNVHQVNAGNDRGRRATARAARYTMESLESRRLLTTTIIANFTGGNGTASADQYAGAAGSGWAAGWTAPTSGATVTGSVSGTSQLNSGGNRLGASFSAANGSRAGAVARGYQSTGDISTTGVHWIEFDYRLDGSLSTFTTANDTVNLIGANAAASGPATSNTWVIQAMGAANGSIVAKRWTFQNGSKTGNITNGVDTGVTLAAGTVYHFKLRINPSDKSYTAYISDGLTGTGHSFQSGTLGFREGTAAQSSFLNVGMTASNNGETGTYSLDSILITPDAPAAPTGVAATPVSASQVNVTWTDGALEDGYEIDYDDNSAFSSPATVTTAAGATSKSLTGLTTNTTWYMRVRATNLRGASPNSSTVTALTMPAAPVVGDVTVAGVQALTIPWNDVGLPTGGDPDYFQIRLSTDGGSTWNNWPELRGGRTFSTNLNGLNVGTQYYAQVRAHNASGFSEWSNAVSEWTLPPSVTISSATATPSSITLNWPDGPGESGYSVIMGRGLDGQTGYFSLGMLAAGTTQSVITEWNSANPVTPGSTWAFNIRAYHMTDPTQIAFPSTWVNVTTPIAVARTAKTANLVTLEWDNVKNFGGDETGFTVEYSTSSTFASGVTAVPFAADHTAADKVSGVVPGLAPNTLYFFRVVSNNGDGQTVHSNVISARTLAATPDIAVDPPGPNTHQLEIVFDNVAGATSLTLFRNTDNNFDASDAIATTLTGENTSYTDFGLSDNTTYYYQVVAYNADGEPSPASVSASQTTTAAKFFDTLLYTGKPALADTQLTRSATIYVPWLDNNDKTNLNWPSYEYIESGVKQQVAAALTGVNTGNRTLFIDIEHGGRDTDGAGGWIFDNRDMRFGTQAARDQAVRDTITRFAQLIADIREEAALHLTSTQMDELQIGPYGEFPVYPGANVIGDPVKEARWHEANEFLEAEGLFDLVQVFSPSYYTWKEGDDEWIQDNIIPHLDAMREYNKPIYPFIMPDYQNGNASIGDRTPLPNLTVSLEESLLRARYDGFVLWGGIGEWSGVSADAEPWWPTTLANTVATPAAPPAAPSGVTQNAGTTLAWTDNASNETGYLIERAEKIGATLGSYYAQDMLAPGTTSWNDGRALDGHQYSYRISAFNTGGFSAGVTTTAAATVRYGKTRFHVAYSDSKSSGVTLELNSGSPYMWFHGDDNAWIKLEDVNFGASGVNQLYALFLMEDQPTGLAQVDVYLDALPWDAGSDHAGTMQYKRNDTNVTPPGWGGFWDFASASLDTITGTHDVYFVSRVSGESAPIFNFFEFRNNAPPARPNFVKTTVQGPHHVDLAWKDFSDDETGFRIYRSQTGTNFAVDGSWVEVGTVAAGVTTFEDDDFTDWDSNDATWYKVVAYNANGESQPSLAVEDFSDAPVISDAQAASTAQINLTWAPIATIGNATADFYQVQYRLVGATDWTLYEPHLPRQGGPVSGLAVPGGHYEFQARTHRYDDGFSAWSNVVDEYTRPAAPAFTGHSETRTSITVNWNDVLGEGHYAIAFGRGKDGATGNVEFSFGHDTEATFLQWVNIDNMVKPGQTYSFMVRAYHNSQNQYSSNDEWLNVTTPIQITAQTLSTGAVQLTWDNVIDVGHAGGVDENGNRNGESDYLLEWSTDNEFNTIVDSQVVTAPAADAGPTMTQTIGGLDPGLTYYFRVTVTTFYGVERKADTSATTYSTLLSVDAPNGESDPARLFSWDAIPNADSYRLYRSDDGINFGDPWGDIYDTQWDTQDLGPTLYYRVVGVIDGVETAPSNTIPITF